MSDILSARVSERDNSTLDDIKKNLLLKNLFQKYTGISFKKQKAEVKLLLP
jgi:hypothetical protein